MKNVKGWFLPEHDTHYEPMMKEYDGKWEYQKDTRDYSLSFVKNWGIALEEVISAINQKIYVKV